MFRRRMRGQGARYFTRNVSGFTEEIFDDTSLSGGFWPVSVFDQAILVPDGLAGVAPLHLVKDIVIAGWSWAEDIAAFVVSNTDIQTYPVVGAVGYYVDQLDPAGVPAHSNIPFLNQLGVQSTVELDDFPLRIVHRRRFTIAVSQFNAPPAGGFGGGAGVGNAFGTNAAAITPGFGTERHIRRRIRLRPNEAFLARVELYNVVDPGGTAADKKLHIQSDILGAISFQVRT